MSATELITVGLSEVTHDKLDWLMEQGHFAEKMDCYRFAIGLALSQGVIPPELVKRTTFVNIGSLDADQALKRAVEALMDLQDTTVYRMIERLADWGICELYAQAQDGDVDFAKIFDQLAARSD